MSLKQLDTVVKLVGHRFPPVMEPQKYLTAVLIIAVLLGDRKLNFFRDGKLFFFDEDGRSNLGGTVVKSGLTLLLSEVYNFKGTVSYFN